MSRRKIVLATGEIYHVFNRSIAKEDIFSSKTNLNKVLEIVDYYRFPHRLRLSKFKSLNKEMKKVYISSTRNLFPLVEVYTYSFMPNHYHFLLKQLQNKGISRFISNFQNSFAKVFNLKNSRNGALFQNQFKAVRIETDEQFLHVSRYIHLNPVTAFLIEFSDLANYPWTSFSIYVQNKESLFVNTKELLGIIGSSYKYSKFVEDQVDYQRALEKIKNLILE